MCSSFRLSSYCDRRYIACDDFGRVGVDVAVALTFALAHLGAWAMTSLVAFAPSRRLADGSTTPLSSLCFSLLAGLVWPLLIVGVAEFGSVAVYSTANSRHHHREIPDSWLTVGAFDHVVVLLR